MDRDRSGKKRSMLREDPRLALALEANLRCADWKNAERIATINVSRGGMFLRTSRHVQVGARAQLTLRLPDGSSLELGATVRHVTRAAEGGEGRPAGVGVQILPEHRNELRALVEIARLRQGKSPRPTVEVPGLEPDAPEVADTQDAPKVQHAPPEVPQPVPPPVPPPVPLPEVPQPATRRRARPSVEIAPAAPSQQQVARPSAGILGIDLGVTYSGASLASGQSVDSLVDGEGRWQIPSVIVFPGAEARPLVGWAAREVQTSRPDLALASVKRLLGRRYSDPHVAGLLHTSSFSASEGPGDEILLRCAGEELAVPQLCALLLRHLVELAGPVLGGPPTRAVLTHPVSYGPQQQEALQHAAQLAEIEVAALLSEPVAAALAYGAAQAGDEIVAVYDFGGGTFDFTLLEMHGVEYRVLGSEGDPWLGGDDFDNALAEAIANSFWRKTQVELRERAVEWQRLLLACEQTKCHLSTAESAAFELDELEVSAGAVSIKHVIERPAFERVSRKLILQSVEICRAVLKQARLTPRDVTRVLLTGGTSRIPLVRRGLERFFDREIAEVVDPEAAVALGAGIHAAWLDSASD